MARKLEEIRRGGWMNMCYPRGWKEQIEFGVASDKATLKENREKWDDGGGEN